MKIAQALENSSTPYETRRVITILNSKISLFYREELARNVYER
jgi:hypothetical protein